MHYQQHNSNANDQDDDIIGEEVRPLPIDSSMDKRMQALHALLQDHTYVSIPKKSTSTITSGSVASVGNILSPAGAMGMSGTSLQQSSNNVIPIKQSTTTQIIDSVVAGAGGNNLSTNSRNTIPIANKYHQQSATVTAAVTVTTPLIPGFPFTYNTMLKSG